MPIKSMQDTVLDGQRVMIRVDFNVPIRDGTVVSDARIRAELPTIRAALDAGAAVILLSHLGRPVEGEHDESLSLAPVATHLSMLLGQPVTLAKGWLSGVEVHPGEVVLCENVRFNIGEAVDDEVLSRKMAALCDVFVMDAFATAHRAQASTHGVAPLLMAELNALTKALDKPAKPVVAIVAGSKVSTKLTVLNALVDKVDHLIVGGGIANTFLAAQGKPVGQSLSEPGLINEAKRVIATITAKGGSVPLPTDVVVADHFAADATAMVKAIVDVADEDMILDIGPETAKALAEQLGSAGTIIWNGPVGVFEFDQFGEGTKVIAEAIASSDAFSIAGGGDTLAAIDKYGVVDGISYISTGGGAFLEFVEGKVLPAVAILQARS